MADPDPYANLGIPEQASPAQPAADPYASVGTAETPVLHT